MYPSSKSLLFKNPSLEPGADTFGSKRRVNSRNTIKNIVNQMISFLSSPECYPILEGLCQNKSLDLFNLFQSIIRHVKRFRRKIKTIDELINMWRNLPNYPQEFSSYMRILSRYFLERESTVRIITSKYVKDKSYHLEIRRYLLQTLKSLDKSEIQPIPAPATKHDNCYWENNKKIKKKKI